jgi:hypothetical protein
VPVKFHSIFSLAAAKTKAGVIRKTNRAAVAAQERVVVILLNIEGLVTIFVRRRDGVFVQLSLRTSPACKFRQYTEKLAVGDDFLPCCIPPNATILNHPGMSVRTNGQLLLTGDSAQNAGQTASLDKDLGARSNRFNFVLA